MESLVFALFILVKTVLVALAGYGVGRILFSESLFEEVRHYITSKCFFKMPEDDEFVFRKENSPTIVRWDQEAEEEIVLSKNGYRTDLPRPFNLIAGKFGDLVECDTCGTLQVILWIGIFGTALTVLPLEIIAVGSSLGLYYVIDRWTN